MLYATLEDSGYPVNRCEPAKVDLVFDWSGKAQNYTTGGAVLFMEHGWLPRYSYQISNKGTNSKSHVAENYRYKNLSTLERSIVQRYCNKIMRIMTCKIEASTESKVKRHINHDHILFPFQLSNDMNLLNSNNSLSKHYSAGIHSNISFAQACIDLVEAADPPLPVVFKQHPVDKNENLTAKLKLNDHRNKIVTNDDAIGTSDIFASNLCKLVISVNSNTMHEALAFGIPGISLGTMMWNERVSDRPLPDGLDSIERLLEKKTDYENHRNSYLLHLIKNQWFLSDFQNPLIVRALIDSLGQAAPFDLRSSYGLEPIMI